jgi:DNA-binding NarL/FixJ family response regulator
MFAPAPHSDAAIDPPPGLRVFRSRVRDTEYAVLIIPKRARNDARVELTRAEREVYEMVISGLSNEAIGARRGTSMRTVANQLQSIYVKLGISSRIELAAGASGRRGRR